MENQKIIGIDIGGTKIHVGLVQQGKIINEVKLSTSARAPKDQILAELKSGIEQLMTPEVAGIGVGVPGLIDEEDGIVFDLNNIPAWQQVHLKEELQERFKKPTFVTNDANSFVLGEKVYGQAKPFKNVVGLSLGTGLGGGIIIDHKLYSGTLSSAGEIGGVPYLNQTLEDYCSGKFFLEKHGISGGELLDQAKGGDSTALKIFQEFGSHVGNAVKVVLFILSPEAVFLGGSVCQAYPFFKDSMLETIHTFPFKGVIRNFLIQPSSLQNAAILGAAALFQMKGEEASRNNTTTTAKTGPV